MLVWWIIVPVFLSVCAYLIWFARRRRKMLETFATAHRFDVRPDLEDDVQNVLDDCFSLHENGLVRSFGQISSVVDGGAIRLFRSVELLDLNPAGTSQSTHLPRIAALVDVADQDSASFVLDRSGRASPLIPGSEPVDSGIPNIVSRIAVASSARHGLTVTMAKGKMLVYLNPLVTGGETAADVESLYSIAKRLRDELGPEK